MDHRSTRASSKRGPKGKSRGSTCKGGGSLVTGRRIQKIQKQHERAEKGKVEKRYGHPCLDFSNGIFFFSDLLIFLPPIKPFSSMSISSTHKLRCLQGPGRWTEPNGEAGERH